MSTGKELEKRRGNSPIPQSVGVDAVDTSEDRVEKLRRRFKVASESQPALEESKSNAKRRLLRGLLIGVIALIPLFGIYSYVRYIQALHVKELLLRQQVMQLRTALMEYMLLYREPPKDLAELKGVMVNDEPGKMKFPLVDGLGVDATGVAVDPLGKPYIYDKATGRISSASPCCRDY